MCTTGHAEPLRFVIVNMDELASPACGHACWRSGDGLFDRPIAGGFATLASAPGEKERPHIIDEACQYALQELVDLDGDEYVEWTNPSRCSPGVDYWQYDRTVACPAYPDPCAAGSNPCADMNDCTPIPDGRARCD